jgi:hypothetical protein
VKRVLRQVGIMSADGQWGTKFGQAHDAQTTPPVQRKGNKARPNNGRNIIFPLSVSRRSFFSSGTGSPLSPPSRNRDALAPA